MAKMKVEFDRCKGCGLCTTACPKKIVEIQQDKLNKIGRASCRERVSINV